MWGIRNFLGHVGFYRWFIWDFTKIAKPWTNLLKDDAPYNFITDCLLPFTTLKDQLIKASIMIDSYRSLPFELMWDANDYVVGVVLVQSKDKHFTLFIKLVRPSPELKKIIRQLRKNFLGWCLHLKSSICIWCFPRLLST